MSAFGCNAITVAFAIHVLDKEILVSGGGVDEDGNEIPPVYNRIGFRLSDRIVSAIDRFVGALSRFRLPNAKLMDRWLFLYPFVGGTDWVHSLNLADAPDSGFQGGRGSSYPLYAPTEKFERFAITWSASGVTHNANGVTFASGGSGNTNCDMADIINNANAWNRRSHGLYSRTNSAVATRDLSALFVEPANGYTYWQGIYPRHTDGICYGDLVSNTKAAVGTNYNRTSIAVADSLGLFSDNQRASTATPYHYLYKRGVYIAGDNAVEIGMGNGLGPKAWMTLSGSRNISFCFSTRHTKTIEYPGIPGTNAEFYTFVQQLQVALLRAV